MRRRAVSTALAALVALTCVSALQQASAQETENIRVVGQIGGTCRAIDVQGDYAYVGEGRKMAILDMTFPNTPKPVGRLALPSYVVGISVSGTFAYVVGLPSVSSRTVLQIIDVSDPRNPVLLSVCELAGEAKDVHGSGDLVFVASEGVQAFDVSDPTSPTLAGWYPLLYSPPGIHASGSIAYFTAETTGLIIVDFSAPATPVLRAVVPMSNNPRGVFVSGSTAYVSCETGLQIVDVQDPSSPAPEGFCPTVTLKGSPYVVGGIACVEGYGGGQAYVLIVDVNDPGAPALVGSYRDGTPNFPSARKPAMHHTGKWAYIPCTSAGFYVLDISDPTIPFLAAIYDTPVRVISVAVDDRAASVIDWRAHGDFNTFNTIDVNDPTAPTQYITPPSAISGADEVFMANGFAYLVGWWTFQVVSLNNLTNPLPVGTASLPTRCSELYVSGSYAYLISGAGGSQPGLQIVDVSIPTSPSIRGFISTSEPPFSIHVDGAFAYVGCGSSDDPPGILDIIDIRNPRNPIRRGGYPLGGYVYVSNDRVYLGSFSRGLDIIDVSDPSSPILLGSWNDPDPERGGGGQVWVEDCVAYVVNRLKGLRLIDVNDPSRPVLCGRFRGPTPEPNAFYIDIWLHNGLVFFCCDYDGLWILQYDPPVTAAERWEFYDTPSAEGPFFFGPRPGAGVLRIDVGE